ncbi:unnamed protein product [Owenia fusiformis]|uniref:Opine dehydrogenase domain-containing protein n=1 Tax=Owenia fusiformis TaxID=6347 RepID=A0A8J1UZ97_OWEFU|nr:unnamed protein product [Owenia fusiformis]
MPGDLKVVVCGGGNAAHTMAGLAASRQNTDVRVFDLFSDEAERWAKALGNDDLTVSVHREGKITDIKSKPNVITNDPSKSLPGADIIIIAVPAFAHAAYLDAIKSYLKPGLIIVATPGQPGFEFEVKSKLGEGVSQCNVVCIETLPWACRIKEFGRQVEILGCKVSMTGAIKYADPPAGPDPQDTFQFLLGPEPVLNIKGHLLAVSLMSVNSYLHSAILYGRWGPEVWDGTPVAEAPLFYQGLDEHSTDILDAMTREVVSIAKMVTAKRQNVDMSTVVHIHDWYTTVYAADITDPTTLQSTLKTNKAYNGLRHPCVPAGDGKVLPDFSHRYLGEDIPYGLTVTKGIAEIVGTPVPVTDMVLKWCQEKMGKEYLVDGKLVGKDVASTRAPQKYGFYTLDDILN